MLTPSEIARITALYNSGTATSAAQVASQTGLPRDLVRDALRQLDLYQKTGPPKRQIKPPRRWKTVAHRPGVSMHADLMDVRRMFKRASATKSYAYLFVAVDVATRYLVAAFCYDKTAHHVGVMARAALKLFPFEIEDQATMLVDSGNEFGTEFKQTFDTDDHTIVVRESATDRGAQLAEAAIRTIRKLAFHHALQTPIDDPVADIRFAIAAHNERYHSAFAQELTPCSAATRLDPGELRMLNVTAYQPERPAPPPPAFAVGDHVRVRRVRNVFEKSNDQSSWSAAVFEITSHRVLDGVNTYKVKNATTGRSMRDTQTEATMQKVPAIN